MKTTITVANIDDKIQGVIDETDVKIREAIENYDAQFGPISVVVGAHPKKQHKNKFIQWLLIKLFGYEFEYKTIMAKTIDICQYCFEEPPIEGKCVCQSCLDWATHVQEETEGFDLDEWLEDEQEETNK